MTGKQNSLKEDANMNKISIFMFDMKILFQKEIMNFSETIIWCYLHPD